jgi:hypothetical protein
MTNVTLPNNPINPPPIPPQSGNVSSLISPGILNNLGKSKSPLAFGDQIPNIATSAVMGVVGNSPISTLILEKEKLILEGINLEIEHQLTLLKLKQLNTPAKKVVSGQTVDIAPQLSDEEYAKAVEAENASYEVNKANISIKKDKNEQDIKDFFKDPFEKIKSNKIQRKNKRKISKTKNKSILKKSIKYKANSILKNAKKSLPSIIIFGIENIVVYIVANNSALKRLVDNTNVIIEEANKSNDPTKLNNAKLARDNAIRVIQKVEDSLKRVNTTLKTISIIVTIFSVIVEIISALPIPTAVPPGIGIPINVIMQLVKILQKANQILLVLSSYLAIISTILDKIIAVLEDLKLQLLPINGILEKSAAGIGEGANSSLIDNPNQFGTDFGTYKGFKFAIKEESGPRSITVSGNKRHYAEAIDTNNVAVLKSELSFTLDPEDLISSLKLIIDSQNLIA